MRSPRRRRRRAAPLRAAPRARSPRHRESAPRGRRRDRWRRHAVDPDQRIGHRPHDDFALADDAIDGRPTAAAPGADDEDVEARGRGRPAMPNSRDEADDRQRPAAVRRRSRCPRARGSPPASTSITSRTAACGTANVSLADPRDDRVGDRQRQRQLDDEARALARRRIAARSCRRAPAPCLRTTAMPTPRPLARSASSRVEKPGRAEQIEQRRRRAGRPGPQAGSPRARDDPRRRRCRGRRRRSR